MATLFLPALIPTYYLILLSAALALAIACLALNLLLGTTGLVSFGHAAYFGLGAYAGGFLHTLLDVDALEAYLLAGMVAAGVAAIFGALCVRGTRVHFTILTLAVAQIVHAGCFSWAAEGSTSRGCPSSAHVPTPEAFPVVMFYVVAAAFALCAWLLRRLTRSPFGLTLRAISGNPTRAALVGIRVRRYQWSAFVISGTLTGLAGGLTGLLDRQVTPEQLHWVFSAKLVLATVLGPAVGAAALVTLRETALLRELRSGRAADSGDRDSPGWHRRAGRPALPPSRRQRTSLGPADTPREARMIPQRKEVGSTGPGLALAAAVLFGLSAPAAKLLAGTVDPWLLAGLLYL